MRKLLLLTIGLTSIALTSQAQINKGTVLLGGNLGFGSSSTKNSGSPTHAEGKGFSIAPSFGFVTATNTAWGFHLSYSNGKNRYTNTSSAGKSESNGYGGGVFYRKYITLGKGFYLFGEAGAGYNFNKSHEEDPLSSFSRTTRTDGIYLNAYPGITYTVSKNFHLEVGLSEMLTLGYNNSTSSVVSANSSSSKYRGFSFSTSLSNSNPFNVGFRFALGK